MKHKWNHWPAWSVEGQAIALLDAARAGLDDQVCGNCGVFMSALFRFHMTGHPMQTKCFWWAKTYWDFDWDEYRRGSE